MSSTNAPHPFLRKVETFLREKGVRRGDGILIGLSGGPDSTALASSLAELHSWKLRLVACYVDHGLRDRMEIEEEILFVRATGRRLGFDVVDAAVPQGQIAEHARSSKKSVEHVAREQRYAVFFRELLRHRLDWIAVGHTLDDQMETILMRTLQGGGISGLRGIPEVRGKILRPLLHTTREEVLQYLSERGLGFRTDSSNLQGDYLRNRVRNGLIPAVRDLFPGYRRSLSRFALHMRSVDAIVEKEARHLRWEPVGKGFRISASLFAEALPEVRARSILALFNSAGIGVRIPRGFLQPFLRLRVPEEGWDGRRKELARGHGAVIERRGQWLWWRAAVVLPCKKGYLIEVREDASLRIAGRLTITASSRAVKELPTDAVQVERSSFGGPLIVRSRRAGDRIQLGGHLKSVKELFAEWRVPEMIRWLIPVVEDRKGVVAILGKELGFQDRIARRLSGEQVSPRSTEVFSLCVEFRGEEGE